MDPRLPGQAMTLAERAAWCALPAAALAAVAWLLLTQPLPAVAVWNWIAAIDMPFALRVDGLAAVMLLMITGIGTAVFVYAGGYLAGHPQQRRLYVLLTAFALAMAGCVTADHLIVLFLFWEMTSLLSYLLVGFNHQDEASRKSAQQAMMVTFTGGLAMLAGFILLWQMAGTARISELVQLLPGMAPTPMFVLAVGLVLLGAFTKSAQFPFHFWLPNAMSAPTPVSAYLHSATMVKLGVYLVARLDAGMTDFEGWRTTLQVVGSVTAAWGMLLALRERDLKRILAWSTVATLGTLVMLVGVPGPQAAIAVPTLLLAHALYKATLFFVAGNVDHGTGTRDIDRLGMLRRAMPWTAAAALLGGLSMAGVPATFGFIAKEVLLAAKSGAGVLALSGVANSVFSVVAVAVAGVAAIRIFWRHPGVNVTPPHAHECGWALVLPPLALACLGLLLGLAPQVAEPLVAAAAAALLPGGGAVPVALAVGGPGLAAGLGTVALTLAIGALVFHFWDRLHRIFSAVVSPIEPLGLSHVYRLSLGWIPQLAARSTRWLQNGRLTAYTTWLVLSVAVGTAVPLLMLSERAWPAWQTPPAGAWVATLVVAMGAVLSMAMQVRLALVLAAGLVGYGSAMMFMYAGAPDVAFTQFSVETVLVIVLASVLLLLRRKGRFVSLPETQVRWGALLAAMAFATVVVGVLLLVSGQPFNPALSDFYGRESLPAAHGRNVVNVILVDFRALDTLGEISVIFLALVAALPLLMSTRKQGEPDDKHEEMRP
ncbi:MAG: proton-conducting transporter membrane subunit [Pseudomonadota bacterium]|nr:proton-conducting transporter membrane subunit [Pseudomonadota bacterium]